MTWLDGILSVTIAIWIALGIYVFSEVKKTYAANSEFSNRLLGLWFVMWGFYLLAVVLSAIGAVWPLPLNITWAIAGGMALIVLGVAVLATGMHEFRSWRRSCGQDTSQLITTGIYRWSRNPQFMGCLLYLLGISLMGRSALAFLLTAAASLVIYWYTIRLAEPYLERLYGEEYRLYKSRTPRWIGIGK